MSFISENVIEVKNLKKHFYSGLFRKKCVKAVNGVSFFIAKGKALGLVGESGSGKSTLGRCVLRLIEPSSGDVYFQGNNILAMNGDLRSLRQQMQIIYQDADGALNPRMKAKDILLEPLRVHNLLNGPEMEIAAKLMKLVNLSADLLDRYPNELSGGQRQRIQIARAISINPDFIIADEAIASLDLLGQAQIMNLFSRLKSERRISFFIISHNLRFLRRTTDMLAVMFFGRFVEFGKTKEIFDRPVHPYTQVLLSARTNLYPLAQEKKGATGEETVSLTRPLLGCSFHPRCPQAKAVCRHETPAKRRVNGSHWVWCHL